MKTKILWLVLLFGSMGIQANVCVTETGYDKKSPFIEVYNFSDSSVSMSHWKVKAGIRPLELDEGIASGSVKVIPLREDMMSADSLFLCDASGRIIDGVALLQLSGCGQGETLQRDSVATAGTDSVMREESSFVCRKATVGIVDNLIWENRCVVRFNRRDGGRILTSAYQTRILSSKNVDSAEEEPETEDGTMTEGAQLAEASPNPVVADLTLRSLTEGMCEVRMQDISGAVVYKGVFQTEVEINMSGYAQGIYHVTITNGEDVQTIKIEKK